GLSRRHLVLRREPDRDARARHGRAAPEPPGHDRGHAEPGPPRHLRVRDHALRAPEGGPGAGRGARGDLPPPLTARTAGRGPGYRLAFGGGGAEAIQVYLETRLTPLLLGEDPLFVERLWERMFRFDRGIKRQGVAAYALSALDIGLWDIVGKAAGLPLYKLW